MPKSVFDRNRIVYGWITLGVLLLGLVSRRFFGEGSFIHLYAGDGLWALMVYFGMACTFSRWPTRSVLVAALGFSVGIELSQLYQAPWITSLRATRLGGLVLGFTFLWSDLLSYTFGVGLGAVLEICVIPVRYRVGLKTRECPSDLD